MARNGADILIDTLIGFGVDTIFGMPGDGINALMEAIRVRAPRVRFVQMRHEESAAFAATAHAKVSGRLGCCLATTGPGGIHLLNGLYDAKLDRAPVIAITGSPYHDLADTFTQQDVDHSKLFMDVAAYSARVMGAGQVENVASLACRHALALRGVATWRCRSTCRTSRNRPTSPPAATCRTMPRCCRRPATAAQMRTPSRAPRRC